MSRGWGWGMKSGVRFGVWGATNLGRGKGAKIKKIEQEVGRFLPTKILATLSEVF